MSEEIVKFDEDITKSLENLSYIKEEFQDEYYPYNKVSVCETTITDTVIIRKSQLNGQIGNDKIKEYEKLSIDHIKTDLPWSEVPDRVSNNVKIEDGIRPDDIHIEFCNELQFCNHCHEVYEDYCTKCRVLVHILNKRPSHNTYNIIKELPQYMLVTRESFGHLGIFCLKVIPEDVRFGPFTGLNSIGVSLRIKGGRFVVNDVKPELLNWMQYINPARNIFEQNLVPFQYGDELYYCSTRRIEEGEELLVYFGEEYKVSLDKNVEMDFVPNAKEDVENVFACTFCCLGFSLKEYLAEHKAVCPNEINGMFSVEELVQCPFCKIYFEAKEYFQHHKDYCCETDAMCLIKRNCALPSAEIERRSSEKRKAKRWKRGIYQCRQCKFRTMYKVDFRHHFNEHYGIKMYKCGTCHRKYKAKKSLKAHVEKMHADNAGRDVQKYSTCNYYKTNIRNTNERSVHSHDEKQCKIQIRSICHFKSLIKINHLNGSKHKCANCEFKTCYRTYLERHMKMKHPIKSDYKCMNCQYQTNCKLSLEAQIKTNHLKQKVYKCTECEIKTNNKSYLKRHIKTIHLKEHDYKCADCEYKTNYKSDLEKHIKTIHLKIRDYKCSECKYTATRKFVLEKHIKTVHLKIHDYNCAGCEYKTNYKSNLEKHIKTTHIKEHDYKCGECEYKTNYKRSFEEHVKTKHLKEHHYRCINCEYQTNKKSSLRKHIKTIHLKEHDYKCTECEYKTNYKGSFDEHVKTKHLKEFDYKCTKCDYKTNRKSHLKSHMKWKHLKTRF